MCLFSYNKTLWTLQKDNLSCSLLLPTNLTMNTWKATPPLFPLLLHNCSSTTVMNSKVKYLTWDLCAKVIHCPKESLLKGREPFLYIFSIVRWSVFALEPLGFLLTRTTCVLTADWNESTAGQRTWYWTSVLETQFPWESCPCFLWYSLTVKVFEAYTFYSKMPIILLSEKLCNEIWKSSL